MPFLASTAARQGGFILANAAKLPTPTFSASSGASGGYTFTILNYDATVAYSFSVDNGGSATQASGVVTVTGLGNNVTATCTVTANKNGFLTNSASTTGTSFTQLATPTFGASSGTTGGYTFAISNYSALNTYSFSVTNSGSATQNAGTVTVTGLADATTATCTVTASRAGFVANSANTTGTSFTRLATPTYINYQAGATPGRFRFNVSIGNYDVANTYAISVSAGSFTRSGAVITVSGLADSQSSTVYITASRTGFATSSQAAGTFSAPGTPCPVGTYLYGPVYYASVGGAPGACGYNGVCDGNYGIGLAWVSGPCLVTCGGDYCAGGPNCCP
jgi:hypothetical protein